MDVWDSILSTKVKDQEKYAVLFPEIIEHVMFKKESFDNNIEDKGSYYLITEEERANSIFVHIVPKEMMQLFRQVQIQAPNQFLGYSVLIGRRKNKEVRVSCFGVPCSILAKALFKNKIVRDVKQENIKNVVLGMVFDENERLLMIQTTKEPYEGFWTLPSGLVKDDDDLSIATKTIIYEQTGIRTELVKETLQIDKFDRKNNKNMLIHFILAIALDNSTEIGADAKDVRWFTKQDLLTINIVPEFKKYIFDELF